MLPAGTDVQLASFRAGGGAVGRSGRSGRVSSGAIADSEFTVRDASGETMILVLDVRVARAIAAAGGDDVNVACAPSALGASSMSNASRRCVIRFVRALSLCFFTETH